MLTVGWWWFEAESVVYSHLKSCLCVPGSIQGWSMQGESKISPFVSDMNQKKNWGTRRWVQNFIVRP